MKQTVRIGSFYFDTCDLIFLFIFLPTFVDFLELFSHFTFEQLGVD